jgi:hypothetical protein
MVLIVCGIGLALIAAWWGIRITPEMLRVRIAQQTPLGSSSEQVLAFLDSLGTEHSEVHSNARSHFDDGQGDFPRAAQAITAVLKGLRKGDLFADGIFMQFKFDANGRLLGYQVAYGYTFL